MISCLLLILLACVTISDADEAPGESIFKKGVQEFKDKQYASAIDWFTKLIEIEPLNTIAYKNRGVAFIELKNYDEAIKDFQKVIELDPYFKGIYSDLGVVYYLKNEYTTAIDYYTKELMKQPDSFSIYFNRAIARVDIGLNEDALEDFQTVLRLAPQHYWALAYTGDLFVKLGRVSEARELYRQAMILEPKQDYAASRLDELKSFPVSDQKKQADAAEKDQEESAVEEPESRTIDDSGYLVQTGAFLNPKNAQRMMSQLKRKGYNVKIETLKNSKEESVFLVRCGPFSTLSQAEAFRMKLKKEDGMDSLVRRSGRF